MTLNSRKTRLLIVLSVAWVAAWAAVIYVEVGRYWDDDNVAFFVVFGVAPVAIPWAIAWILQGKK